MLWWQLLSPDFHWLLVVPYFLMARIHSLAPEFALSASWRSLIVVPDQLEVQRMLLFILDPVARSCLFYMGFEFLSEELALFQVQLFTSYSFLLDTLIDVWLAELRLRMLGIAVLRINENGFVTVSKLHDFLLLLFWPYLHLQEILIFSVLFSLLLPLQLIFGVCKVCFLQFIFVVPLLPFLFLLKLLQMSLYAWSRQRLWVRKLHLNSGALRLLIVLRLIMAHLMI